MTTTAQVKRMVRPLLDRHADLALVGRCLFLRPVQHFARAILIDRTAYADELEPNWAVMHLFEARDSFFLDWGEFLANERSNRRGLWFLTDPEVELSLIEAVETQALPQLRAMRTLDDFLSFVGRHVFAEKLFGWPQRRIILDVALGELDAARALSRQWLAHWSRKDPYYDEDTLASHARLRALCACLDADDRVGLARLLHEWEATTVKHLKIAHLWEPSPFPLETARQLPAKG